MVPKAITLTLVNHSKEDLQKELLQELYKPDVLDELLKESEFVVNRRKEVVGMVQALNKAEEYVLQSRPPLHAKWQANYVCHAIGSWRGCKYDFDFSNDGSLRRRLWRLVGWTDGRNDRSVAARHTWLWLYYIHVVLVVVPFFI